MIPLEPGCPWTDFSNLWLPNIKWCEAQLCSIVVEPANTWSNLAYVLIGLWLWWRGTRTNTRLPRIFGLAELIVGVFSFAFHMSYSGILQILDFAAMFVFVGLTLSFNLVRLGWLAPEHRTRTYIIAVIALTAITFGLRFTSFPIQLVTPVLILATVVTEVLAGLRKRPRYAWFVASLGLLLTATAFSIADASRAMCDPHDHLVQGHAIWHVLSAISLACACKFYEQFGDVLSPELKARYRGAGPA